MDPTSPMPPREAVHPDFDGHLERPRLELSAEEKLDWTWATMELLNTARVATPPAPTPPPR